VNPSRAARGGFVNPWGSYHELGATDYLFKVAPYNRRVEQYPLPTFAPDFAALDRTAGSEAVQATWLGHATLLFQSGGLNFLTDPVFSRRASFVQFAGPARYTPAACKPEDLPPIHVVLISHNHYDHVDSGSIAALLRLEAAHLAAQQTRDAEAGLKAPSHTRPFAGTLFVCPLGVKPLLCSLGVGASHVVELDWWDAFTPGAATAAPAASEKAAAAASAAAPSGSGNTAPGTISHVVEHGTVHPAPPDHHIYGSCAPSGADAAAEGIDYVTAPTASCEAAAGSAGLAAAGAGAVAPSAAAAAAPPAGWLPRIVCVPAQHQSARTALDRNATLWAGYVVIVPTPAAAGAAAGATPGVLAGSAPGSASADAGVAALGGAAAPGGAPEPLHVPPRRDVRFFFSGDTGYRHVPDGTEPLSPAECVAPRCPAFAAVGERYGPIDLAALPIGAYSPRWFMSSFHVSPSDAVCIHRDIRARRSVGMHWGAFPLTDEPIEEPPLQLAAARRFYGLPDDAFVAVYPGHTVGTRSAVVVGRTVPITTADSGAASASAAGGGGTAGAAGAGAVGGAAAAPVRHASREPSALDRIADVASAVAAEARGSDSGAVSTA
jgi:L-ascorbate metabolism protein UlaG (beta-lactamase superfamily)